MKLRISITGKLWRVIPIHWSYSRSIDAKELLLAETLKDWLDSTPMNVGPIVGIWAVDIGQ